MNRARIARGALNIFINIIKDDYMGLKHYGSLDVKGKAVLDIGAFNGDTAKYFLRRGAAWVVCIEKEKKYADMIRMPGVSVINEPFRLEHLEICHDCCKIDIEGYEEILLCKEPWELRPAIMEVHGKQLIDKFVLKGWKVLEIDPPERSTGILINY